MEEALVNSAFLDNIQNQRRDVYAELKEKLYKVKLSAVRDFLERKGVQVDYRITDLSKLKDTVKDDKEIYSQVENFEHGLEKDLTDVIESLNEGSTNAFQTFGRALKSIGTTALTGMAISTAGTLLFPSVPSIALTSVAMISPKIYKGVKGFLDQRKEIKENALNVTLLNLARVEDENEPLRMEIPESVRKIVTEQFKVKNLNINDQDTISFLSSITEFDSKNKIQAIKLINSLTGDRFDINSEINKSEKSISKMMKSVNKNVISPISSSLLLGLHAASVVNDTLSDEVAAALTGIGGATLSKNVALGITAGGSQYALSKFGNLIPFAGSFIEQATSAINNLENYFYFGGAGVAIAGAGVTGMLAFKGIKNIVEKNKAKKNINESVDVLKEDILKKIQESKEEVSQELSERSNKQVILDIVCDELRRSGVDVPEHLQDTFELKALLHNQPIRKKMKVLNVMNFLKKIEEEEHQTFKDRVKNYAKYAYYGGIIALAGLGAYDMFINPGFLENIKYSSKDLDRLSESAKENLNESSKYINQSVKGINDIDVSTQSNSNHLKMLALGKDKVPPSLVDTLENCGGEINYDSFTVDADTKLWMLNHDLDSFEEVKDYISKMPISASSYVESAKKINKTLGGILSENIKESKVLGIFPSGNETIDWDNIKLSDTLVSELKKLGVEPTVDGLQKWTESLGTDAMRVADNFGEVPQSLYSLSLKRKLSGFTKNDWESLFHITTENELKKLGYSDIYEFKDALESADIESLKSRLNLGKSIIPDGASPDEIKKIIQENIKNSSDMQEVVNISDQVLGTHISEQMESALQTIGNIESYEATKAFIESVKYVNTIKNPKKVFAIGAVAGTIVNGFKDLFSRKSKKQISALPEAKTDKNYEQEEFENSLKVDIKDSVNINNTNKQKNKEIDDKEK